MKTKKLNKKLKLNKNIISSLENKEMKAVQGGLDPTVVISMCKVCPPWWTDFC